MSQFKKWYSVYVISIVAIFLSFGLGFYIGGKNSAAPNPEAMATLSGKDPVFQTTTADFAPFWKTWSIINEKYVDNVPMPTAAGIFASSSASSTSATSTPAHKRKLVTDQEKVWGAIQGMVKTLGDPYTVFMPPQEASSFTDSVNGSFQGVGMELGMRGDYIVVVAPLEGTPAKRAGIKPADVLIKVNDKDVAGSALEDVIKLIRGPKGTSVKITMVREGEAAPLDFSVTRDTISIPVLDIGDDRSTTKEGQLKNGVGGTVKDKNNNGLMKTPTNGSSTVADAAPSKPGSGLQDNGVFLLRLYNFSAPSPELFKEAIDKFVKSGSDKFLIDLRGNPGGYMEAAVEMASWFLPQGKMVVREIINKAGEERDHVSKGYNVFTKKPKVVILVDRGSASASEIFSGAMQEHGVAKLVGDRTFGKGSVQEMVPVTGDTFVKVTIAKWFTPNGRSISGDGLTPDYLVPLTKENTAGGRDPQMERAVKLLTEGK